MFSLNFFVGLAVIFIIVLLLILLFIPTGQESRKKKKEKELEAKKQKDWQEAAHRLEKQIFSLKQENENLEKKDKNNEKELMVEKAKVKKLQEKLSQERDWHVKEENTLEQRIKEVDRLKEECVKLQESFSKEHVAYLSLEEEHTQLKGRVQEIKDQRRLAEVENAGLNARVEKYRKEAVEFKKENAELKKKNEDTSWIAKTEYERLERVLKERENELERIKREFKE